MANDKITMLKLKRLLQLLSAGLSQNSICKELGMSKTTVSRYGKASQQTGLTYQELLHLKESDLESILQPKSSVPLPDARKEDLDSLMEEYVRELNRPHVTIQLLWEEYIAKNPDGYQYTQFKKYVNDYQKSHSYAYHKTYIPGKEWQIDFAGDPLYLTDPMTGSHTKVVLLCCIMPYSGYAYCRALPNATMENFFYGLTLGIEYMGAAPLVAKSDNMKQWVKHTNRYEPNFTDETERWCLHYGIIPEACRVRKPKDKAPVESLVNHLYHYVYARIRNERFATLELLNARLAELLNEFNSRDIKRKNISRLDIFLREEKPLMNELPEHPYRFRYRKEVKLGANYHVYAGEEMHSYSVPYQYVGQMVKVLWDMECVEIYVKNDRVAIHRRSHQRYGYTTEESHMPPNHIAYKNSNMMDAESLKRRALQNIGTSAKWAVESMLTSRAFPQQAYRTCNTFFRVAGQYGTARVETACSMMKSQGRSFTLESLKHMLAHNMDMSPAGEQIISVTPQNADVRGPESYTTI